MLPIRDLEANRYSRFPYMVLTLIIVNTIVIGFEFAYLFESEAKLELFLDTYSITPLFIFEQRGGGALTAVTSLFLHGGLLHLFGNMLLLWVFGRRVEDACGPWRFLLFYLTCGLCAGIAFVVISPRPAIGAIGASGAIFGVMGAYLMLYPGARIRVLILWFIPFWPRLRAIWVILYSIIFTQIGPALNILLNAADYRVAYWAHLGGFFGSLAIVFFLRPTASARFWKSLPI